MKKVGSKKQSSEQTYCEKCGGTGLAEPTHLGKPCKSCKGEGVK